MQWNEIDVRLRKLYNCIAIAHSETVSTQTSRKNEEEAFEIMAELTNELNKNNEEC